VDCLLAILTGVANDMTCRIETDNGAQQKMTRSVNDVSVFVRDSRW
jgi:hypothetical protein